MKRLQALGLLGSIAVATLLATFCASAGARSSLAGERAVCIDTPPYDTVPYKAERFVRVAPGVKLEVLDWGGSGEVMVLLTGSGDNAHVFDYFAFPVHRLLPRHWDHPPWMAAIEPAQDRLRCRDKGG